MKTLIRFNRGAAGFTLLEMVITMAILLLLSGAIFGIISGVLTGASTLRENQTRNDQIDALNGFLGKRIRELGSDGAVVSYLRQNTEGLAQSGVIITGGGAAMALDTKLQKNGYYVLRTVSITASNSSIPKGQDVTAYLLDKVTKNDTSVQWAPLITDLKITSWKFEDPNTLIWADFWRNGNKPNMIEFSMQLAGELRPAIMDFWLPPIAPASSSSIPAGINPPTPQMPAPPPNNVPPINVLP